MCTVHLFTRARGLTATACIQDTLMSQARAWLSVCVSKGILRTRHPVDQACVVYKMPYRRVRLP